VIRLRFGGLPLRGHRVQTTSCTTSRRRPVRCDGRRKQHCSRRARPTTTRPDRMGDHGDGSIVLQRRGRVKQSAHPRNRRWRLRCLRNASSDTVDVGARRIDVDPVYPVIAQHRCVLDHSNSAALWADLGPSFGSGSHDQSIARFRSTWMAASR